MMVLSNPTLQDVSDEVFEFLLSRPTLEEVIAFRPSDEAQARLRYLLDANRNETLKDAERAELDRCLQVEYFVRQLKAHAQERLNPK